jgi:hypothetical protein
LILNIFIFDYIHFFIRFATIVCDSFILHNLSEKKRKEKKMTTCYECGENIIYLNDAFDVISKCSNEDCETHKEKERFDPFMSILHQEKRKLLDDLMNGVED